MSWAQRDAEEAEFTAREIERELENFMKLEQHIRTLYTRLFPTYEWVDPTAAVAVMHGEIERLRCAKDAAASSAKVKMAIARERDE